MLAAIAAATLLPAEWQIRTGLHWLVEHFLAYFAASAVLCAAWGRPMAAAALLLPFAVVMETMQGLTADRVPDAATALIAAAGVAGAALLADTILGLRQKDSPKAPKS